MPNITDLIQIIPPDRDEEVEDIFAYAPGLIFTDEIRNLHGDPGSIIVYKSARFGDIQLRTSDPQSEVERKLFSHYLWNAGIQMAELISQPDDTPWSVAGLKVLELGAGVGLAGIVAVLAGAKEVVISDYPADTLLANIRRNAEGAIHPGSRSSYTVEGHEWGNFDTPFASSHIHYFNYILAADCFWLLSQHRELARSMLHFMAEDPSARVFVITGFHTGRAKLAAFFDVAQEEGLEVEDIYEQDARGSRREWLKERDGGTEDHSERKKWLVIARLTRRTRSITA